MKVSLSWLKEYVPIEIGISSLSDALTMRGFEVEGISDRYSYLEKVIVGRIDKIIPHPKAQNLKICHVDIKERIVSIVCGALNIKEGALVPVAFPGTILSDGSILKKSIIREQVSEGMICSEEELGLGDDNSGIMILRPNLSIGKKLSDALCLSDTLLEISITPNRSDCLSIIGIAREIAAIEKINIKYPFISNIPSNKQISDQISNFTSVKIEAPNHCPRYCASLIENVKVSDSPFWLKDRLMSIGLRPINNIVDVTNFVMMEMGQPLHAFDFNLLEGKRIVVRLANEGELFTTLDQKERMLQSDMLMICDAFKPVALAGVMGGLNSEIKNSTKNVLLESAYFSPEGIRKTTKRLGLLTEASYRFERGIDPDGVPRALLRAANLISEIASAKIIDGIIDEHPEVFQTKSIPLSIIKTNRLLGTKLDKNQITESLNLIGFTTTEIDKDNIAVDPPSFRVDISRPEDLIEEVARISGYENIPVSFPKIPIKYRHPVKQFEFKNKIRNYLAGFGFNEVINYSFISKESCDNLRLSSNDIRKNTIQILNPIAENQSVMRTSLIPGLLQTMHLNLSQQIKNLKLFELGKIFINKGKDSLSDEIEIIAGLSTGALNEDTWHERESEADFYYLKGIVEGLFNKLHIEEIKYVKLTDESYQYLRKGFSAQIFIKEDCVGCIGEVHPQVKQNFHLKQTAYLFELYFNKIVSHIRTFTHAIPIPKFPAISRDITLIIDKSVESGEIIEEIKNLKEKLIENILVLDVYEGGPIPLEKRSLSFRIIYRSANETLEDSLINVLHQNITNKILRVFKADLPK